jgi:hypothetical protein
MLHIGVRVRYISEGIEFNCKSGHGTIIDFVRAYPFMSLAVVRWDDNSTSKVFPFKLEII